MCFRTTVPPKVPQRVLERAGDRTLKTGVRGSGPCLVPPGPVEIGVRTLTTRVRTSKTRVRGFASNLAPC